ncbi:MAG: peptidylprolyl isomerase [Flavobacteriales bacterium]|nr:MAG: peptidylprolyl isomerase [Flavobacteriales bacterium]
MFKNYTFILTFIVLIACKDKTEKPVVHLNKSKPEVVLVEEPKKVFFEKITDKNVVERLTAYGLKNPETIVYVYTTKGRIKLRLFKDTPLHRANFILYAKSGYFQHCLFSRVAKQFMAQCGGSYDDLQKEIQDTLGKYTIPAEMSHHHFHKKGAIASARSYHENPSKRSACDEFYFVEGLKYSDLSLDHYEDENNYTYTKAQRSYYKNNPGSAHIDGEHTVFGQITQGFNVISKITHVETDSRDWPVEDIYIDSVIVIK